MKGKALALNTRVAEERDAATVGELTERAYRADGFLISEKYAARLRDAAARISGATVLVAELECRIVATVTLAAHGSQWAEIAKPDELEVRMLAVVPEARRQGIAAKLLTDAMRHVQNLGLNALVLSTETPMSNAHRLYEKLGYVRQPNRDWSVTGYELLVYRRDVNRS
ncbi:Acetyltransferase (GNAT) family protein [Nitrosospira sp. Nl5]|uniref:GNAT family N-acetyltransferase n=1 Tax=Nitrosospira sp. Nl5 TaxID=200120 RepID=UPI00088BED04|nr:GNAT family N-acetyltransferase [Nitrosospira sp. Nl5]SCX90128.1 Acetyltransferase (GNAT) family protein [Nitrosospira sp. Nl5]